MTLTPQHALLPLWADKTPEQKQSYLDQLGQDLKNYCSHLNLSSITTEDLEEKHQILLKAYQVHLGEARETLLDQLNSMQPFDDKEAEDIQTTIEFLYTHPNAINMNCEAGCLTASALVVNLETQQVLLHLHKKFNKYLQFGGHPDFETDFLEVALRESKEESGLSDLELYPLSQDPKRPVDLDVHPIPEGKGKPEHLHLDLRYIFTTKHQGELPHVEGESNVFWWVGIEEALDQPDEKIEPSIKRLVKKLHQHLM
jgi:8-oxo-dGTP pyrophosphatase MutT (NUDIX family)